MRRRVNEYFEQVSGTHRAARRHGREVRGRRRHGGVRRAAHARGRRRARAEGGVRDRAQGRGARPRSTDRSRGGRGRRRRLPSRPSRPARRSTSPCACSRRRSRGEILLGPGARRLAAGAVEVENAGPLEIKGRTEPLWTWRALRLHDPSRRRPRPRSSAASRSWNCSRTRSSGRCATRTRRSSSPCSASRGSARRASSRSSSRAPSASRRCPVERCRTARASPTGRSPR